MRYSFSGIKRNRLDESLHFRDLHSVAQVKKLEIGALVFISGVVRVKILKFEQVQKLEIGALVFISGVVRVKILKFEQARTRHGRSCF
ncbi:hypothetical protein P3S67_029786 [Capsicum chacoense]